MTTHLARTHCQSWASSGVAVCCSAAAADYLVGSLASNLDSIAAVDGGGVVVVVVAAVVAVDVYRSVWMLPPLPDPNVPSKLVGC